MKTYVLLFMLLFALSKSVGQTLDIGLRAGIARSFLTGRSADPNGMYRWNYQGGLFLDLGLGENWHIQQDFQWARKGYRNDSSRLSLDYAIYSPTVSYLFSGFEGETVRGRLLFGLYGGRLLDWQRSTADYREVFREWDYGAVWGGGLTFLFYANRFKHYLHIDLRGQVGAISVYTEGAQVRNVVWQLTLGYSVPIWEP